MTSASSNVRPPTAGELPVLAFENISTPGAYLLCGAGLLVRMPHAALTPGRSPALSITGADPVWTVRLSSAPWVPISEARRLATDQSLPVHF